MAKPKKSAPPAPPVSARAKKATPAPAPAPAPATATRAARATPAPAKPAAKQAPPRPESDTIHTWHGLQEALRVAPDAAAVQKIMDAELAGPARLRWLLRIQGRLQIIRNEEEVEALTNAARS